MWAAGYRISGGLDQPLIQHWNGTGWSLAEGEEYVGAIRSWHLARVPGTTSLWAIGGFADQTGSHSNIEVFGTLPG